MLLDLIGAIALTAASAIVIGALCVALPWSAMRRAQAAAVLTLWFALVVALGATGVLDATTGVGPAGVGIAVALPLAVLGFALYHPRLLAPAVEALPVPLLVGVNAIRVLGLFFVLLYASGRLPAPFAPSAGWGDVFIGLTALPVAYLAATRTDSWRTIAGVWNALGLLDLVSAIVLGITSSPGTPFRLFYGEPGTVIMSGLPWLLIPAFLVPLLALTHLAVFARLFAARRPLLPARA